MDKYIARVQERAAAIFFTGDRKPLYNVNFYFWKNYIVVIDPTTRQVNAYNVAVVEEIRDITQVKKKRQTTAT